MNSTLPSWVWSIVFFLSDLAWHINETADGIYDVWLVGVYLAEPFYTAADYVQSISNLFIWEDGTEGVIGNWILTLPSLEGVIALLISYIPHFRLFIDDPMGFVQDFFAQISDDFWRFIYDTRNWFAIHFYEQATWLVLFISDPLGFILDELTTFASWVMDFFSYPLVYIDYWVRQIWPNIDEILDFTYATIIAAIAETIGWIWDFLEEPLSWVYDLLSQFNLFIALLLSDPYEFFNICVALALNLSMADLLDFPRYLWNYVLDWIVDYVQDSADRFVQVTCDVIMLFM